MTVYLVGAGPGDPDLLTVRATRVLSRADVVVCDRLIDDRVLALVPARAVVVHVGKTPGDPAATTPQSDINDLLIEHARAGRTVVRLKGGDPYLFGRGGEEARAVRDAHIDLEVVPGISSALGAPALASIPVTHRGVSSAVTIVSGHDVDAVAWSDLARWGHTIVVMMGVANLRQIGESLTQAGMHPSTPVAVLERVATRSERRWRGQLSDVGEVEPTPPAVIVIGAVAALGAGSGVEQILEGVTA